MGRITREIQSAGGKAAHAKGTAHEWTREDARIAGRKGGEKVSADRAHMAEIGRKGGAAVSKKPGHMAEIGRVGGKVFQASKRPYEKPAIRELDESIERELERAGIGESP